MRNTSIMKIKLSNDQVEFLETGTVFVGPNGFKWYYMPFWFKETEEKGTFEELSFDKLPEDFKKVIRERREVPSANDKYDWALYPNTD